MPSESHAPLTLVAQGVGRRDPKTAVDWLLRGVDLTIRGGERLVVVGPSGAGKTVLLRALAGLDPIDEGTIFWQGRAVSGDEVPRFRRDVTYLHQRPALFEGRVETNLKLPFELKAQRDRRYDEPKVVALLEALGRDRRFLDKPHHDLSGGEAQVTALVRALQLDPRILLLDEATSSLDQATARAAETLLDQWHKAGDGARALVWVTHDPEQARRVAERRITLNAGRITADPSVPPSSDRRAALS